MLRDSIFRTLIALRATQTALCVLLPLLHGVRYCFESFSPALLSSSSQVHTVLVFAAINEVLQLQAKRMLWQFLVMMSIIIFVYVC